MRKAPLVQQAIDGFCQAGIENAPLEAQWLLQWATGWDRLHLLHHTDIPAESAERFLEGVRRRIQREPMAFITGKQGFWTLDLAVSPDTLIPRPDSETLIEALLALCPERSKIRSILDLGTGTGCLLLAALVEYPHALGVGVDISDGAVLLAQHNAQQHDLDKRASFQVGSWTEGVEGHFDIILSNPPYIEKKEIEHLMPEVALYEPHRALDGGDDGLSAYRLLCRLLPNILAPGGFIIFELGAGQEEAVTALAEQNGLKKIMCRKDLGGIPRALVLAHS
ncbi:peptide chain release factor N(5)-glutamine methyltransferase [Saccharibacter sp. 17.LH.SD]|nr:peptide chain release factor N(5)-glutamine methyltransferase [Saccharibacter sp. 17.LH.SD]